MLIDYQKQRILAAYHLEEMDSSTAVHIYGWQQYQARTSIGSGGLLGRGLFHSPRVNLKIVPEQESDMIFSVAGEQLGFIGCFIIIVLLLLLLWQTLRIARNSSDILGRSICMGFFGMMLPRLFSILACALICCLLWELHCRFSVLAVLRRHVSILDLGSWRMYICIRRYRRKYLSGKFSYKFDAVKKHPENIFKCFRGAFCVLIFFKRLL